MASLHIPCDAMLEPELPCLISSSLECPCHGVQGGGGNWGVGGGVGGGVGAGGIGGGVAAGSVQGFEPHPSPRDGTTTGCTDALVWYSRTGYYVLKRKHLPVSREVSVCAPAEPVRQELRHTSLYFFFEPDLVCWASATTRLHRQPEITLETETRALTRWRLESLFPKALLGS